MGGGGGHEFVIQYNSWFLFVIREENITLIQCILDLCLNSVIDSTYYFR